MEVHYKACMPPVHVHFSVHTCTAMLPLHPSTLHDHVLLVHLGLDILFAWGCTRACQVKHLVRGKGEDCLDGAQPKALLLLLSSFCEKDRRKDGRQAVLVCLSLFATARTSSVAPLDLQIRVC